MVIMNDHPTDNKYIEFVFNKNTLNMEKSIKSMWKDWLRFFPDTIKTKLGRPGWQDVAHVAPLQATNLFNYIVAEAFEHPRKSNLEAKKQSSLTSPIKTSVPCEYEIIDADFLKTYQRRGS